jgi:hypothetical protein
MPDTASFWNERGAWLRNEATALRNRQEFQRGQLTELASTDFESWVKESFEIATKIAYRNGGRIGMPKGGNKDCTLVAAARVLPMGYVVSASRIADRWMMLAAYRLADLLTRVWATLDKKRSRPPKLLYRNKENPTFSPFCRGKNFDCSSLLR